MQLYRFANDLIVFIIKDFINFLGFFKHYYTDLRVLYHPPRNLKYLQKNLNSKGKLLYIHKYKPTPTGKLRTNSPYFFKY